MSELAALMITLGLLAATLAWLRRADRARPGRRLETLETLALAPGRSLALVRADGRRLLVAVGRDSISLVAELNAPAAEAPALPGTRAAAAGEGP